MKQFALAFSVAMIFAQCSRQSDSRYVQLSNMLEFHEYDDNGILRKKTSYSPDTILNGETLLYYENGQIARKHEYKNGKLFGQDSIFYNSGALRSMYQWYDSVLIHSSFTYYDSLVPTLLAIGKDTVAMEYPIPKVYTYHNSNGEGAFFAEYNINGTVNKVSGDAIVSIFSDTLVKYNFTFLVAIPPFLDRQFILEEKCLTNSKLSKSTNIEVTDSKVEYKFSPKSMEDDYEIIINYSLDYLDNVVRITDSVKLKFASGEIKMERLSHSLKN